MIIICENKTCVNNIDGVCIYEWYLVINEFGECEFFEEEGE